MYFPRPYPDELLYSLAARCRVHLGLESHKGLLRLLFNDIRIAAVTDLPTHLELLASNIGWNAEELLQQHTLFPLYAPFIPEARRNRLRQAMLAADIPGAIGVAGLSTSLIKWPAWLRYCPLCFEEMKDRFGEVYWRRCWQAMGADACTVHSCILQDSPVPYRRQERHEFIAASPVFEKANNLVNPASSNIIAVSCLAQQLLSLEQCPSPGHSGWTRFYQKLAAEHGACRGRQVRSSLLWERVRAFYSTEWLAGNCLLGEEPPSWFLAIFRKHRNSFSFLQHLMLWSVFRPGQAVEDIIKEACSVPQVSEPTPSEQLSAEPRELLYRRECWLDALSRHGGAKQARSCGGGALYAWLYRHDQEWLMQTNNAKRIKSGNNSQIDWGLRDRQLVRLLIQIEKRTAEELTLPRKSRNWYLGQLPHRASVAYHLGQMPLCRAFLERYSESVGEFQIRRLTREILKDFQRGNHSHLWELERRCGLQKGKMAPLTVRFINRMGDWG